MKKIVLLVGVLFACSVVRAQVEVSELFIPSAPGFILADKAPASIEKTHYSQSIWCKSPQPVGRRGCGSNTILVYEQATIHLRRMDKEKGNAR